MMKLFNNPSCRKHVLGMYQPFMQYIIRFTCFMYGEITISGIDKTVFVGIIPFTISNYSPLNYLLHCLKKCHCLLTGYFFYLIQVYLLWMWRVYSLIVLNNWLLLNVYVLRQKLSGVKILTDLVFSYLWRMNRVAYIRII